MPTNETLTEEIFNSALKVLKRLLTDPERYGYLFVIQQVYELGIVIINFKNSNYKAKDKVPYSIFGDKDWRALLTCRNTISHNFYNHVDVYFSINVLLESNMIEKICQYIYFDGTLSYQLIKLIKEKVGV